MSCGWLEAEAGLASASARCKGRLVHVLVDVLDGVKATAKQLGEAKLMENPHPPKKDLLKMQVLSKKGKPYESPNQPPFVYLDYNSPIQTEVVHP